MPNENDSLLILYNHNTSWISKEFGDRLKKVGYLQNDRALMRLLVNLRAEDPFQ